MTITFIIALCGYVALGTVAILDKFILTKSVTNPLVYTFYSTGFMLPFIFLLPFVSSVTFLDGVIATISGIAFGLGIHTMFIAISREEASHIAPFIGAMVSIFTFLLSSFILGEILTFAQQIGVIVLIVAGLLLSYQDKGESVRRFHSGFLWAVLSGFIFGFSHVLAKYIYLEYPFVTGLVWTKGTVAIVAVALLFFPSVRRTISPQKQQKSNEEKNKSKNTIALVGANKILGVVGALLIQYAIAIGSVTIVNAMAGIQYVFVFIGILLLTKFFPTILSEYVTRREIQVEVFALLLVIIGSALFFI